MVVNCGSRQVFQYTGVFEPGCGQEEVFTHAVAPLLAKVKAGGNCTVLACGQTGSGKSHTIGTHPSWIKVGIISPNDFNHLFIDLPLCHECCQFSCVVNVEGHLSWNLPNCPFLI